MKRRNALLDQCLIIMIRKTEQPLRYMAIAAPNRIECVPISFLAIWRVSSPIAKMASCNAFEICFDVM